MSTAPLLTDNSFCEVPEISPDKQIITKSKKSFPLCCCSDNENDISIQQFKIYQSILKECEENFDKNNPRHLNLLKELEQIGLIMMGNNNNSSVWRFLGFQTDKPEKDFRAGGSLSAEFIIYVLRNNIINETDLRQPFFCFALTCIKILYNTKIFFHLFDSGSMKVFSNSGKYLIANRKQIKIFCELHGYEKENFFMMLSKLLDFVFKKFKKEISYQKKEEENYSLMEPLIEKSMVKIIFNIFIGIYK